MAKAEVTLKLTTTEFDLVRKAVTWVRDNQNAVAKDHSTDVKLRNEARQDAVLYDGLLKNLA